MHPGSIFLLTGTLLTGLNGIAAERYYLKETLEALPAQTRELTKDQVSVIPGRLKNQTSMLLKQASVTWEMAPEPGEFFVEFWLKPEKWNGLTPEAVTLATFTAGKRQFEIRKAADNAELQLLDDGVPVQSYPLYNWLKESWMDASGRDMWHYLNLGFTTRGPCLTVDGFSARELRKCPAAPPVRQITLLGGPGTAFSWLHAVGAPWLPSASLRARYRNLYRGEPDLHRNTVTVPWFDTPPKLDGSGSDPVWDQGARITGFASLKGKTLREEDLAVCLGYDARYLYMRLQTPYRGELRARHHKAYDMPLWGEEAYEIFLHPPYTGVPDFCQLIGNPHGDQADLKMLNLAWNGKWDWRTSIKDNEWLAEFRADFKGISTPPPGPSAVWTMNLLNSFADAGWCWTQRYNDSASFGTLRFEAGAPAIRPGRFHVTPESVAVPLEIRGGKRRRTLSVGLQVYGPKDVLPSLETVRPVEITSGGQTQFNLELTLGDVKEGILVLFVRDGETELFYHSVGFPPAPLRERTGYPEEKAAVTPPAKTVADSAPAEPTPEQQAYQRKWSAAELGETVVQSSQWQNNRLGYRDDVPKPWTPMTVDGQNVRCWNRVYRYQDSLLPARIESDGAELFADSPRLVLRQGRQKHPFAKAEVRVEKVHDGLVRVRTTSRSGPFLAEVQADYEFDGMAKMELTVSCPDNVSTADAAFLEFPLNAAHSGLFHLTSSASGHAPSSDSGAVPAAGLQLDAFREVLWLGDHRRGFCWFAESLENWPLRDETAIQTVSPVADAARVFRLKLADKPFRLERPWKIVFGLQATPTRPRSPDFRRRSDKDAVAWRWFWGDGDYYPFQSVYTAQAKAQVEKERLAGREVMPCSSLLFMGQYRMQKMPFGELPDPGLMHRELLLWGPLWESTTLPVKLPVLPERQTAPDGWFGKLHQPVAEGGYCPASPWQDFYLWKLAELIRGTGLGALYLDQPMIGCCNTHHGCGYINYRGELTPRLPLFARRQMLQRMYRLFYDAHGQALIRWHSSNQIVPPLLSFIDIFWDGENYGSGPHKVFEFYSKSLTPERLQAQHTGLPFGFASDLLPEFEERYAPTPASVRDMLGVFMVHDGTVWPAHTSHARLADFLQTRKLALPLEQMQVLHYWDNDPRLQVTPATVTPLLYWNRDQALLVLFNWSDDTVAAEVQLGLKALDLPEAGWKIADHLTGTALPVSPARFTVPLQPRDLRLLHLAP